MPVACLLGEAVVAALKLPPMLHHAGGEADPYSIIHEEEDRTLTRLEQKSKLVTSLPLLESSSATHQPCMQQCFFGFKCSTSTLVQYYFRQIPKSSLVLYAPRSHECDNKDLPCTASHIFLLVLCGGEKKMAKFLASWRLIRSRPNTA